MLKRASRRRKEKPGEPHKYGGDKVKKIDLLKIWKRKPQRELERRKNG